VSPPAHWQFGNWILPRQIGLRAPRAATGVDAAINRRAYAATDCALSEPSRARAGTCSVTAGNANSATNSNVT